ncbi:hypothetical protein EDD18DRAFT_1108170 [Armillaria luteobubalina]|uniref:Uncharacterized protein n=1 Tax=Armillaria luteobubalina TaxID=153913 RepID=A0AA39PZD8_9AGAR|nr:hypothetical protein EDD18DRAFT_1108170 [Armillaria luteobubalina]
MHDPGMTANINLQPEKSQHHQIYTKVCICFFKPTYHYYKGHRAQEHPSMRIDVRGFLCFIIGDALDKFPLKGKRGCHDEFGESGQRIKTEDALTLQAMPTTKAACVAEHFGEVGGYHRVAIQRMLLPALQRSSEVRILMSRRPFPTHLKGGIGTISIERREHRSHHHSRGLPQGVLCTAYLNEEISTVSIEGNMEFISILDTLDEGSTLTDFISGKFACEIVGTSHLEGETYFTTFRNLLDYSTYCITLVEGEIHGLWMAEILELEPEARAQPYYTVGVLHKVRIEGPWVPDDLDAFTYHMGDSKIQGVLIHGTEILCSGNHDREHQYYGDPKVWGLPEPQKY